MSFSQLMILCKPLLSGARGWLQAGVRFHAHSEESRSSLARSEPGSLDGGGDREASQEGSSRTGGASPRAVCQQDLHCAQEGRSSPTCGEPEASEQFYIEEEIQDGGHRYAEGAPQEEGLDDVSGPQGRIQGRI